MNIIYEVVLSREIEKTVFRLKNGDVVPIFMTVKEINANYEYSHQCRAMVRAFQSILTKNAGTHKNRIAWLRDFVDVESTNELSIAHVLTFMALERAEILENINNGLFRNSS